MIMDWLSISVPFILPHMQVDKGAIRFVLSGANIMCPGLTSPGAKMTKLEADKIVVSFCNGEQYFHIYTMLHCIV